MNKEQINKLIDDLVALDVELNNLYYSIEEKLESIIDVQTSINNIICEFRPPKPREKKLYRKHSVEVVDGKVMDHGWTEELGW